VNHDLWVLSFVVTAVCKEVVSYAKHHENSSAVGLTVKLFSKRTCEVSSEMPHEFLRHCPGTPYSVATHVGVRHFLFLSDACGILFGYTWLNLRRTPV